MSAATKAITVTSDGMTYILPGQAEPTPPNTYAYGAAVRGDTINVREEDYDRFVNVLGCAVDPDTRLAELARTAPRPSGPPVGAVPLMPSPTASLVMENERVGWFDAAQVRSEEERTAATLPADVNPVDRQALGQATVEQLRHLAVSYGVRIEPDDTRDSIADKIVEVSGGILEGAGLGYGVGQATGAGPTGPDETSAQPATDEQMETVDADHKETEQAAKAAHGSRRGSSKKT